MAKSLNNYLRFKAEERRLEESLLPPSRWMPASDVDRLHFIYSSVPEVCDSTPPSTLRSSGHTSPTQDAWKHPAFTLFFSDLKVTLTVSQSDSVSGKQNKELWRRLKESEVPGWMIHILYFQDQLQPHRSVHARGNLRPGTAVLTEPLPPRLSSNQYKSKTLE